MCGDIYTSKLPFYGYIAKYIPVAKINRKRTKPSEADSARGNDREEQQEYFGMKLLSLIHETCVGEQFEEISALDFYANMNLHPCNCKLKIKPREKIRVCYLIFLMSEKLLQT